MSFRGHRNESAYTLDDRSVDHGNFLETILLISEYDVPLNSHVQKVIDKSKKRREKLKRQGKENSRGRRNLVIMLSKSTVNKILLAILDIIKSKIIQEIGEKKFSVQMDGTQDTATVEQETIILRYVLGLEVKLIRDVSPNSVYTWC